LSTVEVVYGILFEPAKTLNFLGREKPLLPGLLIFCLTFTFISVINRAITLLDSSINNIIPGTVSVWLLTAFSMAFAYIMLALMAGLFSLISEIIYRRGNASGLLACLSFAVIPGVLGPSLQYAAILLGIGSIGVLFSLFSALWVLILQILSLREALDLNTGQAVLLFTLPGLLFVAAFTGLSIILVSTIL